MAQLSYSINTAPVAFPGQPADNGSKKDVLSVLASEAIPYGVLVALSTAADAATIVGKLPTAGADFAAGKALGVALADQARAQDPSVAVATYPAQSAVPCMKTGRVWVLVEENVSGGDQAFVRFAAGAGGSQKGAFRKSADTASAAALPGGYFVADALAGGYAELQLNLA